MLTNVHMAYLLGRFLAHNLVQKELVPLEARSTDYCTDYSGDSRGELGGGARH